MKRTLADLPHKTTEKGGMKRENPFGGMLSNPRLTTNFIARVSRQANFIGNLSSKLASRTSLILTTRIGGSSMKISYL